MATRLAAPGCELYQDDFYAWAKEQAALIRAGRFSELDLEHLIEEVDDLGESLYRSLRSRIRTIIEHLLKLQHSPTQDPRGLWYDTVLVQRRDLVDDLTPHLTARLEGELQGHYARARNSAARSLRRHGETAAADALPETCPYGFEQITGDWLP